MSLSGFWGSEIWERPWLVLGLRNSEISLAGFGVPKFGNFFGWFWGSEIRKFLWLVLGFRNSETFLAGFGVPKFGNFFGWFWGSEIRKLLWLVLGFRNSETSLGGFGAPKFKGWRSQCFEEAIPYYFRVTIVPKSRDKIEPVICS